MQKDGQRTNYGLARTIQVVLFAVLMLGTGIALQASDRQYGDIFVGIGNGQYQVWHNTTGTNYSLAENPITQGGGGSAAGCAFDSTYHPFTTNSTLNNVYRDQIADPQTPIQTIGATGATSIAFDLHGNYFVGAGSNILEFSPGGTLLQTYSVAPNGPATWIDLSANGSTIYFTNGHDQTIYTISNPGGGTPTPFATIGDSEATVYGIRVLPAATQTATGGLLLVAVSGFDKNEDDYEAAHDYPNEGYTEFSGILLLSSGGTFLTYDDFIGHGIVKSYSVSGENFQVLTHDPNGTSFWAGNPTTGNFYRFAFSSGIAASVPADSPVSTVTPEVGPLPAGAGGPTGLCAYGAFNAAQPQPITMTAPLTSGSPTFDVFIVPPASTLGQTPTLKLAPPAQGQCPTAPGTELCNEFTSSLVGLTVPVTATFQYLTIDPAAGASDPPNSYPCELSSLDGQQCEVFLLSLSDSLGNDPATAGEFTQTDLSIFSKQSSTNPVTLDNETANITAFVLHGGTRTGGSCTTPGCKTIYTNNDEPLATQPGGTTGTSCGYLLPLPNMTLIKGLPAIFTFWAVTAPGECKKGPFLTGKTQPPLKPRLTLVQLNNLPNGLLPPAFVPATVVNLDKDEDGPYYDPVLATWTIVIDTRKLQGAVNKVPTQYLATTFDDSGQIASFSMYFSLK